MSIDVLKRCELFQDLNEHQLKLFDSIFQECSYQKDDVIFSQGDSGNSLFVVASGQVSIQFVLTVNTGTIKPIINKLSESQFFGELALIDSQPRTARATAVDDCTLLQITKADFDSIVESHKDIGYHVIKSLLYILIQRIRQTDQQLQGALMMGWNAYKFDQLD